MRVLWIVVYDFLQFIVGEDFVVWDTYCRYFGAIHLTQIIFSGYIYFLFFLPGLRNQFKNVEFRFFVEPESNYNENEASKNDERYDERYCAEDL